MAIFMTCTTTMLRLSLARSRAFSAAWTASFLVSATDRMAHNDGMEHWKRRRARRLWQRTLDELKDWWWCSLSSWGRFRWRHLRKVKTPRAGWRRRWLYRVIGLRLV